VIPNAVKLEVIDRAADKFWKPNAIGGPNSTVRKPGIAYEADFSWSN